MGPVVRGPTSGGWELDGPACTYLSHDGLVVSVAIISTQAFDLERHDPQSVTVASDSASAYAARPGPLGRGATVCPQREERGARPCLGGCKAG